MTIIFIQYFEIIYDYSTSYLHYHRFKYAVIYVLMMYFVLVAEHKHLWLILECGKMSDLKG